MISSFLIEPLLPPSIVGVAAFSDFFFFRKPLFCVLYVIIHIGIYTYRRMCIQRYIHWDRVTETERERERQKMCVYYIYHE